MLAKKNRFHGHGGVKRAYRLGTPARSAMFSMHVHRDSRIKSSKVAVVVSKKVHKSAVKRNRIRRRIYEVIRPNVSSFKQPTEIVVTAYTPEIADTPHDDLTNSILTMLKKSKVL